jgi:hypothetical protein
MASHTGSLQRSSTIVNCPTAERSPRILDRFLFRAKGADQQFIFSGSRKPVPSYDFVIVLQLHGLKSEVVVLICHSRPPHVDCQFGRTSAPMVPHLVQTIERREGPHIWRMKGAF